MTEAVQGAGELTPGTSAASERVQQLRAMIAELSRGPASFAAQLNAAMDATQGTASATGGSATLAPASTATTPAIDAALAGGGAQDAGQLTYAGLQTTSPLAQGSQVDASFSGLPASNAGGGGEASGGGGAYAGLIDQAAARNGIEPAILAGLIQQESGFDPNSTSGAGAQGLTQLMPGTAASLGVTEPLNPAQSIEGGARYLGEMMRQFGGNVTDALAAYNAGPGAVQQYGGVPPYSETQQYVTKVLGYAANYRQGAGAGATATQGTIA